MNKTLTAILALLLVVILPLKAITISGRIVDKESKTGVEFARVMLLRVADNKLQKGTVSGTDGRFSLADIDAGKYLLKISFTGYLPIELPLRTDAAHPELKLGVLELSTTAQNLQQVEVTGRKSQVKFEIDRKVYNVEQNVAVAGASVTEVLRNIPSVEVAPDGNILLRNNKNVIVWINGRPSGLNDDNRSQILDQIPAETIERVEVITNPSSKYSPDGSAGIINIVTKKNSKAGRSGSVTAGIDSQGGWNVATNLYYTSPRWEVNANAGYRREVRDMVFNSDRLTYNPATADTVVRYSRDKVRIDGKGFFGRLAATWHATERDHLSASAMATQANRSLSEKISNLRIKDGNALQDYRYSDSPTDRLMVSVALDYIHSFGEKGHELRAYAGVDRMKATGDMTVNQMDSVFRSEYYQWKNSEATRTETTLQLDYTRPVGKTGKLEAGYKGEFAVRDNTDWSEFGIRPDVRTVQYELNNIFGGTDNRHSLYLNYGGKLGRLAYQAGLRGELNRMQNHSVVYDKAGRDSTMRFDNHYPGLYPSLFLDYELPRGHRLQLNYSRRINRPKGRMNNPFRSVADSANIEYGNPDLKPEYTHSFELSHIKTWEEHSWSGTLYYRSTQNVMQSVNYVETQGRYDIKFITTKNVTNMQAAGSELMLKNRLLKLLDLTTTCNIFYSHLDGFDYMGTHYAPMRSLGWSGRMMANVTTPSGWAAQLTGGYQSRRDIPQGESLPLWGVDLGLRKAFLAKRLQAVFTVRDVFNSRLNRDVTDGYNFHDYSEYRIRPRTFALTLTYTMGTAAKKTEKTKENYNPLGGDD